MCVYIYNIILYIYYEYIYIYIHEIVMSYHLLSPNWRPSNVSWRVLLSKCQAWSPRKSPWKREGPTSRCHWAPSYSMVLI